VCRRGLLLLWQVVVCLLWRVGVCRKGCMAVVTVFLKLGHLAHMAARCEWFNMGHCYHTSYCKVVVVVVAWQAKHTVALSCSRYLAWGLHQRCSPLVPPVILTAGHNGGCGWDTMVDVDGMHTCACEPSWTALQAFSLAGWVRQVWQVPCLAEQ
jgi:hypothetical protein